MTLINNTGLLRLVEKYSGKPKARGCYTLCCVKYNRTFHVSDSHLFIMRSSGESEGPVPFQYIYSPCIAGELKL